MLPFKLIYSDAYYLPIGQHVFPSEKYQRVRERLIAAGVAEENDFLEPQPANDEDILLVHTPEYVDKLATGTLSAREELALEVPYSRDLVEAFWLAAGGSILAARQALTDRVSIRIGGGLRRPPGEGHGCDFCGKACARRSAAVRFGFAGGHTWSPPEECKRRGCLHHLAAPAQQLSHVVAAVSD